MRKLYTLILSLLLAAGLSAQQAPDFTLTDVNGNTYNLYDQLNQGKTVVLDFFGVQCGTCQTDIPYLEGVWQSYGGENSNILVWGIESLGFSNEELDDFVNSAGGTYTRFGLGENTELLDMYQITYIPSYFVVCPNGFTKLTGIENVAGYIDACSALDNNEINSEKDELSKLFFNEDILNIGYTTESYGEVSFELYDVLGNKLNTKKVYTTSGTHTLSMQTSNLRPGFYILRMMRGKKLIMAKRMMKN